MAAPPIKLSYIPAQYRVRIEITKALVTERPVFPEDVLERARKKLKDESAHHRLAFHFFFEERARRVWQLLSKGAFPLDTTVGVTLATGAPLIPGIEVGLSQVDEKIQVRLTLNIAKDELKQYRWELFKLNVIKQLQEHQVQTLPNPAQLHALYLRACRGETIKDAAITALPRIVRSSQSPTAFDIQKDPTHNDLWILIHDVKDLGNDAAIEQVIHHLQSVVQQHPHFHFSIERDYITRTLHSANRGPERLGLDLPLVILGASYLGQEAQVPVASAQSKRMSSSTTQATPEHKDAASVTALTAANIHVDIAPDKMSATLREIDPTLYGEALPQPLSFWHRIFAAKGVKYGLTDDTIQEFVEKVRERQPVDGMVLALGMRPTAGAEPYFAVVYQEANRLLDQKTISLRERQPQNWVHKGQVIAEIRFKKPFILGKTVTDEEVHPDHGELPLVHLGEGVATKGPLQFIATIDGVPAIQDLDISVQQSLSVPHSVNLTSGNIHFNGPVIIKGNIESGAVVEVGGDLTVQGVIEGGTVRVGGNLQVNGGILANKNGGVYVQQNITADFIDNAKVECRGSVTVSRSITNADLVVGENLTITAKDGVLFAGNIMVWGKIECHNFGRSGGAPTKLSLGYPFASWRRFRNLSARLERLRTALKEAKNAQRLVQTERVRASQKNTDRKIRVLDRADRLQKIVKTLEEKVRLSTQQLRFNEDTLMLVAGVLSKNVHMEVCGVRVPVPEDIAAAKVLKGQRKPARIESIEEAPPAEGEQKDAKPPADGAA